MKILITGSSGYCGYVLSKYFSEKGIKVVGLSQHENHAWKGNKNFKFYQCDVTNKKKLHEIFSKEQPTCVIHLAYAMNPMHDKKREDEVDIVGSVNTLEVSNETKSVKQFIKMSSASIYGGWPDNRPWIKETAELRPRDWRYAVNKKIVEEYYDKYDKRKDMKLVILRMCTAIGPLYHKGGGVVALLTNSPVLPKLNNRYCEVQFLHEDDMNALMNLIVHDKKIEGTYNYAPDSYATIKELAPDKFFLVLPLWLARGLVRILWWLHLSETTPGGITLTTYGIIIDPHKLMRRYHYKFKYTTKSGFEDTVKKRKAKGTL